MRCKSRRPAGRRTAIIDLGRPYISARLPNPMLYCTHVVIVMMHGMVNHKTKYSRLVFLIYQYRPSMFHGVVWCKCIILYCGLFQFYGIENSCKYCCTMCNTLPIS